jgi:hypothetical protein
LSDPVDEYLKKYDKERQNTSRAGAMMKKTVREVFLWNCRKM